MYVEKNEYIGIMSKVKGVENDILSSIFESKNLCNKYGHAKKKYNNEWLKILWK